MGTLDDARSKEKLTEIRFAHFSIKEFLSSTERAQDLFTTPAQGSHLHIAKCCLAYHLRLGGSIVATKKTVKEYALWKYAAQCWAGHLEKVESKIWPGSVTAQATTALAAKSQALLNMARICDQETQLSHWDTTLDTVFSPLYYASYIGAPQITALLIDLKFDLNEHSKHASPFGSALQIATARGNEAVVRLLVENGSDVNLRGGEYATAESYTALYGALLSRPGSLARLFDENGDDANIQNIFL